MAFYQEKLARHFKALWNASRLADAKANPLAPMYALRDLGEVSIPHLRRYMAEKDKPEAQIRSAVVLHWLKQKEALPFLIDTLQYRAPEKNLHTELNFAFVQIGVPDASMALADAWRRIPGLSDNSIPASHTVATLIELRDANVIPVMADGADKAPNLFCRLCEGLGPSAVPGLVQISNNQLPDIRITAISALERLGGEKALDTIAGLLRDNDYDVRDRAADAVMTLAGPVVALNRISAAYKAGYLSRGAIRALTLLRPPDLPQLLVSVIDAYQPDGSTDATVCEAISATRSIGHPNFLVVETMCALVDRKPSSVVLSAAADLLASAAPLTDSEDTDTPDAPSGEMRTRVVSTLDGLLSCAETAPRSAASVALRAWGEPYGAAFCMVLEAGRPSESLFKNLQQTFANAQDMGAAVNDAVQHVTNWITRFSRETAEKYVPTDSARRAEDWILEDERVPMLLARLLQNCLELLTSPQTAVSTRDIAASAAAALKALGRLDAERATCAMDQIHTAAFLTYRAASTGRLARVSVSSSDELLQIVRVSAGQTLVDLRAPGTFEFLIGGMDSLADGVLITTAISLGKLGETRAIPVLQQAADKKSAAVAAAAVDAISRIKKANPDTMTLLRGSSPNGQHDSLLRPASDVGCQPTDILLRPVQLPPGPDQETAT